MSDILEDPTATLAEALARAEDGQSHDALQCFLDLHRHKLAGGSLPAQERGEGTAVAKLIADARDGAATFQVLTQQDLTPVYRKGWAEGTMEAIRAVTGEG